MKHTLRRLGQMVLIAALAAGLLIGFGGAERASAGGNVGPKAMLEFYYSQYINTRDYANAYRQWIAPEQTYQDFVNGYATTTRVDAYFGGYQPGEVLSLVGHVPGVLIGYHSDGSQVAAQGCYDVRYNPAESGARQWLIADGNFTRLNTVPTPQAITGLLDFDCSEYRHTPGGVSYYNVQGLLSDYFGAVNDRDYAFAYSLWMNPAQTYDNFVVGWQDTTETVAFYGAYQFSGVFGVAESGRVPVMLLGYHTDGELVAFQGCIGLNFNAGLPRHWSLYDAYLTQLPAGIPAGTVPTEAQVNAALTAACY